MSRSWSPAAAASSARTSSTSSPTPATSRGSTTCALPAPRAGSVDTVVGDLFDHDALCAAMEDSEAVVHLAAYADVGIVAKEPVEAEECNSRGTLAVLEAARETGTRVVYGSTIWVYGASGDGLIDEDAPLGLPDHLYTASKLAGEMYCTSYAELYDVPARSCASAFRTARGPGPPP